MTPRLLAEATKLRAATVLRKNSVPVSRADRADVHFAFSTIVMASGQKTRRARFPRCEHHFLCGLMTNRGASILWLGQTAHILIYT